MEYWHWLILGGVFLIFEIVSITTFFLFLSISAFIMALITFISPALHINIQLLIASILALMSCIVWYIVYKNKIKNVKYKDVNDRLDQYIGKKVTLLEDVSNSYSKIKIGDTTWRVNIPEGKEGDSVEIIGHASATFIAKPVS